VLGITNRLNLTHSVLELLLLAICIFLPVLLLVLLSIEQFLGISIILVSIFLILILSNYKYGLYFIVVGLPLFQSISMKSDSATTTGINLQYVLIPVLLVAWLSEKLTKKELANIKLPYLPLFTVFVVVLALSIVNQIDVVSATHIKHGFIQLYALLNYLILFYILVNEKLDTEDFLKIFRGFLIVAFIASVIGIYQYLTLDVDERTGVRVTSIFGSLFREDTKSNPNDFGAYLAFMIMIALFVWNITIKKNRIIIAVVIAAIFCTLLVTFSRSSLLATIFSILFYTFYHSKKAFFYTVLFVVICLIGLYFEPTFHKRIISIYEIITDKRIINIFLNINPQNLNWAYIEYYGIQGYGTDIISGAFRIWAWIQGVLLFLTHPFLGVGYHLTLAYSPWPTAENLYLDIASMTGVVGLLLFIIIQINFLKDGFKLLKTATLTHFGLLWLNILAVTFFVSLTGSVLFGGKLLGLFWILAALFYNVKQKEDNHIYQQ